MPLRQDKDSQGCYWVYGDQKHYYYKCGDEEASKRAKAKAIQQMKAIKHSEYSNSAEKISFDYHQTLQRYDMQYKAKQYLEKGIPVYVISASDDKSKLLPLTQKLGISDDNVYATGSDAGKILKIKELGITSHYDNNEFVIEELPNIGILVK